jgi:hypothetical protein
MTTTRTGHIGNTYEYDTTGRRLPGTDRGTIDYMVSLSQQWPETYHQYVGPDGYETWAHNGREITEADLPAALRGS